MDENDSVDGGCHVSREFDIIENDENLPTEIQPRHNVSSNHLLVTDLLSNLKLHEHHNSRLGNRKTRSERRKENLRVVGRQRSLTRQGCSMTGGTTRNTSTERLLDIAEQALMETHNSRRKERVSSLAETRVGNGVPITSETMSYSTMCIRDSNALADECPDSFGKVDTQWFTLLDAVQLADQLNTTLPKLPKKDIIMSKDQRIPMKNKKDGLLHFTSDEVDGRSHELDKSDSAEERGISFDFSENAKSHSNIYEHVEITEEQKKQKDALRQKYIDILNELNKDIEFQKSVHLSKTEHRVKDEVPCVQKDQQQQHNDDCAIPQDDKRPSSYPNAIRIFGVEHLNRDKTKYTYKFHTCSVSVAWKFHLENDPSNLHWYEILRDDFPCHLYFDLEYPKGPTLNENVDGDAMVDTLLSIMRKRLDEDFGLSVDDTDIYELDSTTLQKFSRHLIIKIPGHAFSNNVAVGDFVSQVCADSGSSLLIHTKDGSEAYFVDTAVYTKNRLFRLVYNCKGGKTANFMPTKRFAMSKIPRPTPAAVFKDTLLTSVEPTSKLLLVRPLISMGISRLALPPAASHCGIPVAERRGIKRDNENDFIPSKKAMCRLEELARAAIPTIEAYASKRANQPASVRNFQICGGFGTVAYNISGHGAHYCSNVGRDHESNFIYIVANFFSLRMSQKCHDRDCYKYKSPSTEMPERFRWDPNDLE